MVSSLCFFFFFKQKTAYEMRISDWSSDVCSSDLCILGLVMHGMLDMLGCRPARLAKEGQEHQPPRIEAGQQRREHADAKSDITKIGRASCRERVCQYG